MINLEMENYSNYLIIIDLIIDEFFIIFYYSDMNIHRQTPPSVYNYGGIQNNNSHYSYQGNGIPQHTSQISNHST